MKKLSQKDMAIFAENHTELKQIIALLHEYGVKYKEKKTHNKELKPGDKVFIDEKYDCSINIDIARILAKIAFNYFAYCAIQENKKDILYLPNFDKIRRFIHVGTIGKIKEIIPSISEDPILKEEIDQKKRLIFHLINFRSEGGQIVVRMTFFGLQPIYKVIIGPIPEELNFNKFGCGHGFDPFNHTLHNLSQNPITNPTVDQMRLSFGLFRRIC